jgi:hypothetical protein
VVTGLVELDEYVVGKPLTGSLFGKGDEVVFLYGSFSMSLSR